MPIIHMFNNKNKRWTISA